MEKYIISGLVVISVVYLLTKAFGAWNRKSNCDACANKCNSRAGCGYKGKKKEIVDKDKV